MCVVNNARRFLAVLVMVVVLVCMTGTIAYAEDDGGGDTGVTEYITSGLMKDQFNNLLSEINGRPSAAPQSVLLQKTGLW